MNAIQKPIAKQSVVSMLDRLRRVWFAKPAAPKRDRAAEDPAGVFDEVLAEKNERYEVLKKAVAGVLYLRNKVEGDLRERRAEIARTHHELRNAVRSGDEQLALELITRKHQQHEELERAERELDDVRSEAGEAKEHLARIQGEIRALEREKLRVLATLSTENARARMEAVLTSLAEDGGSSVLDRVREQAAKAAMERSLDRELAGQRDPGLWSESAYAELRAMEKELRPRKLALAEK